MGSYKNIEKVKEQFDKEISRLSKGFSALNIDYKKGVLKTAQGLLRIQRAQRDMTGDGTGYSVPSMPAKKYFGDCYVKITKGCE